jgi:small subunit ribosomal protein S20
VAHSRSARKRWRQSLERRARNRAAKSHTRTLLKKAIDQIRVDAGNAEQQVREAISAVDRAVKHGVLHANAGARTKARLMKKYNLAVAGAVAAAAARRPVAVEPRAAEAEEAPAPRRRILSRRAPAAETKAPPKGKAPAARPKAEAKPKPKAEATPKPAAKAKAATSRAKKAEEPAEAKPRARARKSE